MPTQIARFFCIIQSCNSKQQINQSLICLKLLISFEMENQTSDCQLSVPESRMQFQGKKNHETKYEPVSSVLNKNLRELQIRRYSAQMNFDELENIEEEEEAQCNVSYECVQETCQKIVASNFYYYSYLIILVVFLVSCLLWDPESSIERSNVVEIMELVCHILFFVYFIVRLLEWKNQKIFWLIFDFLLITSGIVAYALEDGEAQRYFKAFRTLRLIYFIREIKFLNQPSAHLIMALAKVGNLLIPAFLIIYVYAVVGLYSFSDFQYNRCRTPENKLKSENWTFYDEQIFLCGERKCPVYQGQQLECLNPIDYNVNPDEKEVVNLVQGNGLLRYNNIFYAFFSTFKQTFVTGSSRLILLYKQVLNPFFVYLYYYSYIYLISYIYLNIFYSLIIVAEWDSDGDNEEEDNEEPDMGKSSNKIKNDFNLEEQNLEQQGEKVEQKQKQKQEKKQSEKSKEKQENRQEKQEKREKVEKQKKLKKKTSTKANLNRLQSNASNIDSDNCQEITVSENLKLEKTKIHNIFEEAQQQPDIKEEKIQKYSIQEQAEDLQEDTTLPQKHPKFFCGYNIISNVIIVLTCVNLSLEFHGQSQTFQYTVSVIDFSFYILFVFEVLFKVAVYKKALGRLEIGAKIDIVILLLCSVGVCYEAVEAKNLTDFLWAKTVVEKVFRTFKYLRIFVLILETPFFKESRLILTSTFKAVYSMKNVILLWFLIVLIVSIMGFHLHSYKTKVDKSGNLDLANGKGFQVSMDGVFQSIIFTMLTFYNEEWDYLMFQQYLGSGGLAVVWQLISIIVGLILFSTYFMALLMKQLETLIENKEQDEKNEQIESDLIPDDAQQEQQEMKEEKMQQQKIKISQGLDFSQNKENLSQRVTKQVSFNLSSADFKNQSKNKKKKTILLQENISDAETEVKSACIKSFLIFLRKVLEHRAFQIVKILFIFASCTFLINSHPQISRTSTEIQPYLILDKVCIGFFILELIVSLIVFGLFQEPTSYLRRSWLNWLNIVIIIVQILSFTSLSTETVFLKIERIKVLRIIFFVELRYKNNWNMRMTFHAFIQLLPKVLSLLAITLILFIYFALILVKVYKDDFYFCENYYSAATIQNKNDCLNWGGDWIQRNINTANLFNSTLFLFLVATTEGWISLMTPMMNMRGTDLEPSYNANQYINIFFVIFFFFGNLIMLNVFIGLSVTNFKWLKEKTTGENRLTKKEKMWLSVKEQIYRLQPLIYIDKPKNTVRGYAYEIAMSKAYKVIKGIFFVSFLITMSLFKSNMTREEQLVLNYIQYVFVGILFMEEFIELLAFGFLKDIRSIIFKNFVLVYCIIYIILDQTASMDQYVDRILGSFFISLQFVRYLVSLLNQITFARKLMNSIATILPRTSNILLIISITLFIYAIIGMELFSYLKPNIELDEHNQNYTDFGSALFALIKFSTMESPIQQIIDAAQTSQPNFVCYEIFSYDDFSELGQKGCGSQASSYIFFLSFHIFYSLLLMSTLMAVIVDGYSEVKREENAFITKFVLEKVRYEWSKIDPEAKGFIPYRQFWMFTAKLLQIYMGQEISTEKQDLKKLFSSKEELLNKMNIPIYENQSGVLCFQFHQVIESLTRIYIQNHLKSEVKSKKTEEMFKERQSGNGIQFKRSYYTSSHVSTLIILKSGLRWWKNLATSDTGPLEYKLIMQKFAEQAKQ